MQMAVQRGKKGVQEGLVFLRAGVRLIAEAKARPSVFLYPDVGAGFCPPLREEMADLEVLYPRTLGGLDEAVKFAEIKAVFPFVQDDPDELDVGPVMADRRIERRRKDGNEDGVHAVFGCPFQKALHKEEVFFTRLGDAVPIGDAVAVQPVGDDEIALLRPGGKDGQVELRPCEHLFPAYRLKGDRMRSRAEFPAVDLNKDGTGGLGPQKEIGRREGPQQIGIEPCLSDRIVVCAGKCGQKSRDIVLRIEADGVVCGTAQSDLPPHLR